MSLFDYQCFNDLNDKAIVYIIFYLAVYMALHFFYQIFKSLWAIDSGLSSGAVIRQWRIVNTPTVLLFLPREGAIFNKINRSRRDRKSLFVVC